MLESFGSIWFSFKWKIKWDLLVYSAESPAAILQTNFFLFYFLCTLTNSHLFIQSSTCVAFLFSMDISMISHPKNGKEKYICRTSVNIYYMLALCHFCPGHVTHPYVLNFEAYQKLRWKKMQRTHKTLIIKHCSGLVCGLNGNGYAKKRKKKNQNQNFVIHRIKWYET